MVFFLALSIYITSLVASLILFIAGRRTPVSVTWAIRIIHLTFLVLFVVYLLAGTTRNSLPLIFPLSLLGVVCSGLMLFGITINTSRNSIQKFYLILYPLTLPVFIVKPSALITFLITMEAKVEKKYSFCISENVFIEKQNTSTSVDNKQIPYKLVMKRGLFTQTLQRDIGLPAEIDSITTLLFITNGTLRFRAYFQTSGGQTDSSDIQLSSYKKK